jgi:hypothetical protein
MKIVTRSVFAAFLLSCTLSATEIHGSVVDSYLGQPLSNVDIQLGPYRTHSNSAGQFTIRDIAPGDYLMRISTVGYRLSATQFHLDSGETKEFQIVLTPDSLRHTDTVTVHSGSLFDPIKESQPGQFSLGGNDLKNLGTVLADDPLRAVQAVPGVTSNDDFEARFSIQGADFNRIGIYLDGILLHDPVHTVEGTDVSGSASVFNTDLVDHIEVYDGAYPAQFQDSSAAALDVDLRDGSRDRYRFRLFANFADAGGMAEGPLGKLDQCSWITGFRKSYLQYILNQALTDPSMAFGIEDVQGRLACNVGPRHTLTLDLIDSNTGLNRTSVISRLGANSLMLANQHLKLANFGWRYTPGDNLLISNHVAWIGDSFNDRNPELAPLGSGNYREWAWNGSLSWMWNSRDPLNAGVNLRSIADAGYANQYNSPAIVQVQEFYRGNGMLTGGFLSQSWSAWNGRLSLAGGLRWDRHTADAISVASPQGSLAIGITSSTRIQLGWGQYSQFPEISQFFSNLGSHALLPVRSTHAVAGIEQRIGVRIRLRAEVYDREDRDLIDQPFLNPRIIGTTVFIPPRNPIYTNGLRERSRGAQIFLQRVSANGLSGWVSYAYSKSWMHDSITNQTFPADWDQRHTIGAYASYRIRPTINLSARWTYGSGFPLPGYYQLYKFPIGPVYRLSNERNTFRIGPYQRLDIRINKVWTHRAWKTTLYGEVMNVTNRANYRFDSMDGYYPSNRLAYITIDKMFPILPSVGVVFER